MTGPRPRAMTRRAAKHIEAAGKADDDSMGSDV